METEKKISFGDKLAKKMKSNLGRIILFIVPAIVLCSLTNPLGGKILGTIILAFVCFSCL